MPFPRFFDGLLRHVRLGLRPLLLTLCCFGPGWVQGESIQLRDLRQVGDFATVKATLQVEGKLLSDTGEYREVPMKADCQVAYQEYLQGRSSANTTATRHYQTAMAELNVGGHEEKSALPSGLTNIVALQDKNRVRYASPEGCLSRSELELLTLPGDHLSVYRLLPSEAVDVGSKWQHASEDMAALLSLDHVGTNEVTSELVQVENGLGIVQVTGEIGGRDDGVVTSMRITGDYRYDLRWNRIVWVRLRIHEQRDESAAVPGLNVNAELRMLITPVAAAERQASLAQFDKVSARDRLLRYQSQSGGYELLHPRRWYLVDERPRHVTFRVVDGGDVVAQCNVVRLKDQEAGKHLALDAFQKDIQSALGERFGQFESAKQSQRKDGNRVLSVAVLGTASEVPVRWVYYHVADNSGKRVNLIFVMNQDDAEAFGRDDRVAASTIVLTTASDALPGLPEGEPTDEVAGIPAKQR